MDSYAATVARMPALRDAIAAAPEKHRVLTGERPTGPLHLGHLLGTIVERVRLQRAGVETVVILADYQVITDREVAERLPEYVRGAVLDQLALQIDPRAPERFRRMEDMAQRDWGQRFWWSPGRAAPQSAPNLGGTP